jgi:4-hydroxybenzoate polyprenyltransferase
MRIAPRPDPLAGLTPSEPSARSVPVVVDLGALVHAELLVESLFALAKRRPLRILMVPIWLARGSACLRQHLADEGPLDPSILPYDRDLVAALAAERHQGTRLVLVSAADRRIAVGVADHLKLFDEVISTDGRVSHGAESKRDLLVERFGAGGFDYVGRGYAAWRARQAARKSLIADASAGLVEISAVGAGDEPVLQPPQVYLRSTRVHHWLKNLLVFVPLIADHGLRNPELLSTAALAFVAFSLCASSTYLVNDLFDLPNDRRHPRKKNRPLASGQLAPTHAIALLLLMFAGGLAIALLLPWAFFGVLLLYCVLTLAYSLRLKDIAVVDVLVLAGFYGLRVVAGVAALDIALSAWLLACCLFLFFSLALVKRYAELMAMRAVRGSKARARAYLFEDRELLAALGGASGYLSVLVLAIYATSGPVQGALGQYLVWALGGLLLYWITYMWLMAHRGRMDDDPLVFALKDRSSRVVVALLAAILVSLAALMPVTR